ATPTPSLRCCLMDTQSPTCFVHRLPNDIASQRIQCSATDNFTVNAILFRLCSSFFYPPYHRSPRDNRNVRPFLKDTAFTVFNGILVNGDFTSSRTVAFHRLQK